MNKKTEIRLCHVGYVCADGEFIPSIFSSDNKSVKNIITDEVAPMSLLFAEDEGEQMVEPTNEFAQKLSEAEEVKLYTFFNLGNSEISNVLPLLNYATTWDRFTNKIVKYVYDRDFGIHERHIFTIEDYQKLAKFLEKAYVKKQKEMELKQQEEVDKNKKSEDYANMFKF